MGFPGFLMPALADNGSVIYDQATHSGVWIGGEKSTSRQIERLTHEFGVCRAKHQRILWPRASGERGKQPSQRPNIAAAGQLRSLQLRSLQLRSQLNTDHLITL